jgi:recombination DNA repair RAD52 pathway protein
MASKATQRLAIVNARISELEPYSRFTADQLLQLMEPLSENRVSKRSQSGSQLSYVEAHDIKNMLIRIFGFGGFSSDVVASDVKTGEWFVNAKSGKDNVKVLAVATVKVTLHPPARRTEVLFDPVTYTETAVSSQTGADEGDTADFAMKTAESDAFKRAAIFLGTQMGLSLYAKGSLQDQVRVVFEPTQAELLKLGQERRRIHQYLASVRETASGPSTKVEVAPGASPAGGAPEAGAGGALAGGFAHPEGRA